MDERSDDGSARPRMPPGALLDWIALVLAGLLALGTLQPAPTPPVEPQADRRAPLRQPGAEEARRLIAEMLAHD